MEIIVKTIPEKKEDNETTLKIKNIIDDRNKIISKRFEMSPLDIQMNLYYSTSELISKVGSHDERLGVFSGYKDYEDVISIAHPLAIEPIFADNLYRQVGIMIDYTLIKMYMCKKYYPQATNFKLYYKYVSDVVAKITSGNFLKSSIEFDIKHFSDFKKYKKEQELSMALYVMLEKSGLDFIYDNLDLFMKDCDIKKSLMTIYKKEFKELVGLYQKQIIDIEKKLKLVR